MVRRHLPEVLEVPPETPEEQAASLSLREKIQRLTAELHAQNLANAIILAQQAACGHGPLVDHFAELGRRYSHLVGSKPTQKNTKLRVVTGGRV